MIAENTLTQHKIAAHIIRLHVAQLRFFGKKCYIKNVRAKQRISKP